MKQISVIIMILFFTNNIYTQINIAKPKVTTDTSKVPIVEVYDSLQNFESYNDPRKYSKYTGLKVYLPASNYEEYDYPIFYVKEPYLLKVSKLGITLKGPWNMGYENIFTNVYHPVKRIASFHYYSKIIELLNKNDISDKYYVIQEVIYGKKLDNIINYWRNKFLNKSKEVKLLKLKKRKWKKSNKVYVDNQDKIMKYPPDFIFKMITNNNDTVYFIGDVYQLILVPYFVKQRKLYENKQFVAIANNNPQKYPIEVNKDNNSVVTVDCYRNEIWLCTNVVLDGHKIKYILKNDKKGAIVLNKQEIDNKSRWITREEYNKQLKIKEKERIERNRKMKEKERQKRIEKENHRKECIRMFGEKYGNLIAENKVDIGMTKEMVKASYGIPVKIFTEKTEYGTYNIWKYDAIFGPIYLYFSNGKLKKIKRL